MRLFLDLHDQCSFTVDLLDGVVDGLEIAAAEDAPHVEIDRFGIERLADASLHRLQHHCLIDAARALDLDRIDFRAVAAADTICFARTAAYCSGGKDNARSRSETLRAAASPIGTVFTVLSKSLPIVAELGQDQDVARG